MDSQIFFPLPYSNQVVKVSKVLRIWAGKLFVFFFGSCLFSLWCYCFMYPIHNMNFEQANLHWHTLWLNLEMSLRKMFFTRKIRFSYKWFHLLFHSTNRPNKKVAQDKRNALVHTHSHMRDVRIHMCKYIFVMWKKKSVKQSNLLSIMGIVQMNEF